MEIKDWLQILFYFFVLVLAAPILGVFFGNVFENKKTFLTPIIGPLEKWVYRISGIDSEKEMNWKEYLKKLIYFNLIGFVFLFLLLFFQNILPLNPQGLSGIKWDLAFNTTVSFVTNTNWQSYSGETTMGYFSQMVGLNVQNFLSAASGIVVLIALIRGFQRKNSHTVGNLWHDLVKSILYILMPFSIIWAFFLTGQGVIQNFSSYVDVQTLEGVKQTLPMGPAASQIAIKQLGTNGGGFLGVNSAHPFENPTPLSNFLQMLAILIIPAALIFMFGKMLRARKQAWMFFLACWIMMMIGLGVSLYFEFQKNPVLGTQTAMEGKEARFGVVNSVLWAVATTDASNGSVNAMHDSLSPMAGLVTIFNMMLGEVIFGGVGVGLTGLLVFAILTVFIAGLMVGRTPEFLGKKIEAREIKWAVIAALLPSVSILIFTALGSLHPNLGDALSNKGPHGFSELLYAYTSASANNGSAFAGLATNNVFFNITQGLAMLIGRFSALIPVMVIAGSLAAKKSIPESAGTFKTDTFLFVFLLIGVIFIIGGLGFFPALSLGPILEHLLMNAGIVL